MGVRGVHARAPHNALAASPPPTQIPSAYTHSLRTCPRAPLLLLLACSPGCCVWTRAEEDESVGGGAGVTALNNCSSIVRSAWLFEKKEKTFFGKLTVSTDRCGNREREGTRTRVPSTPSGREARSASHQ